MTMRPFRTFSFAALVFAGPICIAGCMTAYGHLFEAVGPSPSGPPAADALPAEIFAWGRAHERPAGPDTLHVSLSFCFDPPPAGSPCDAAIDLGDTTVQFADVFLEYDQILCTTANGDTLCDIRGRRENRSSCDPGHTRACKSAPPVRLVVPRAVDRFELDAVVSWRRLADGATLRVVADRRVYRRRPECRLVPASR